MAQLRHASRAHQCPQFGVQRTYRRHRRIDVNDPEPVNAAARSIQNISGPAPGPAVGAVVG